MSKGRFSVSRGLELPIYLYEVRSVELKLNGLALFGMDQNRSITISLSPNIREHILEVLPLVSPIAAELHKRTGALNCTLHELNIKYHKQYKAAEDKSKAEAKPANEPAPQAAVKPVGDGYEPPVKKANKKIEKTVRQKSKNTKTKKG